MLRSDYDRKRGQETSELRQLREQLIAHQAKLEVLQNGNGQPAEPAPSEADLRRVIVESSDPDEIGEAMDKLVEARASKVVNDALRTHPLIAQASMEAAARSARPQDIPEDIYRQGYSEFMNDVQSVGLDPRNLDPEVVKFLTPVWAERAALRARLAAPSTPPGAPSPAGGGGGPSTQPRSGAPAVTPSVPPVSGGVTPPTARDVDAARTHGPSTSLAERVKATLDQMD